MKTRSRYGLNEVWPRFFYSPDTFYLPACQ